MPGLLPNVDPDGLLEYSVVFSDRARQPHVAPLPGRHERHLAHAQGRLQRQGRGGRARQRHLRHGSRGAAVCDRQALPGHPQRLVQLSLDADLRHGADSGGVDGAQGPPRRERQRSAVRAAADRRGRRRDSRPTSRTWCSRRTSRPHPASSCPTPTSVRWPTPCTRSAACSCWTASRPGAIWVDMEASGVDVLISAPQKGWSSSAGLRAGDAERARAHRHRCDAEHQLCLRPEEVAADHGGLRGRRPCLPRHHAHRCADAPARQHGRDRQLRLRPRPRRAAGARRQGARAARVQRASASVAADGFTAPGVVVSYTTSKDVQSGKAFAGLGLQAAAGVPLQCDEPADFQTFRLGLFGLDKLQNVDRTVANLPRCWTRWCPSNSSRKTHACASADGDIRAWLDGAAQSESVLAVGLRRVHRETVCRARLRDDRGVYLQLPGSMPPGESPLGALAGEGVSEKARRTRQARSSAPP